MTWRARSRALLREPLVHFAISGAAIFALFGNAGSSDERRIVVDAARIERLAGEFAQSFRRLPSQDELDALIREDVKDEVYYREGLRLGLDRDDVVVKRRMRSKLQAAETTADDLAAPDDATLQRWLDAHPDRFAGEPAYTFDQRFAGSDAARATAGLAALQAGGVFTGEPVPLADSFTANGADRIRSSFGDGFAAELERLPIGRWAGPVTSGFGLHLVRVRARIPAPPPTLAAVRQRVENDWRAETARRRSAAAYARLLAGYDVIIEKPR